MYAMVGQTNLTAPPTTGSVTDEKSSSAGLLYQLLDQFRETSAILIVNRGAYPDCHDSGFVRDTSASCAAARFTTKLAAFHVIIIVNGI